MFCLCPIFMKEAIDTENKKGMVTTSSLSEIKHLNLDDYDVKLFIVRYPGKVMDSLGKLGFVHLPQLSPSKALFDRTQIEKKTNPEEWYFNYEQGFLGEMAAMKPYMDRIKQHLNEGKNVLLVCCCSSVSICHRNIIGNILAILGYPASIK